MGALAENGPGSPPPYYDDTAYDAYPSVPVRARRLRRWGNALRGTAIVAGVMCTLIAIVNTWNLVDRWLDVLSDAPHRAGPLSGAELAARMAPCEALAREAGMPPSYEGVARTENPRWSAASPSAQRGRVTLRNATLFDGEAFLTGGVDIVFSRGVVESVSPTSSSLSSRRSTSSKDDDEIVIDLHGAHVTPGMVDMHSHHGLMQWPWTVGSSDGNEVHADSGPLTPWARAIDGMMAYDAATTAIASGGVTSSLIIPGSANVMGGEGTVIKNWLSSGPAREPVVAEMLLERGVPPEQRRRYMKMACGENPKGVYGHTRMGNAYVLRHHLARAKGLVERQDGWCARLADLAAEAAPPVTRDERERQQRDWDAFAAAHGASFPEDVELETTVGLLRGRIAMHNHCYLPHDFETMLRVTHEFGFGPRAFHHAIGAWMVPEMLKELGGNVTIATFAEASLYKMEAYEASLWAGAILHNHSVPVAYKSDHAGETTNAKYLMLQPAVARYFHLPADKALQAVTSVPAKALDLDYRVGYVRPGYDADIVVWDAHPLSIGATPRQVYIDGVPLLDPAKVEESMGRAAAAEGPQQSVDDLAIRVTLPKEAKEEFCAKAREPAQRFVISGIRQSYLESYPDLQQSGSGDWTLVIDHGRPTCLDTKERCQDAIYALGSDAVHIAMKNGHLAPGLTAISDALGMSEVSLEPLTSDGTVSPMLDPRNPANVDHAKYGVSLEGKAFVRARLGGVTRAVTAPLTAGGLVRGVSVGIRTGAGAGGSHHRSALDGGVFQGDVALHVSIVGENARVSPGSISMAVQTLRDIVKQNTGRGNESVYGLVADGKLPLVIEAMSKAETEQVILLKREFPAVRAIIYGGQGAPFYADELAKAEIPVILKHRAAPEAWDAKDVLVGPPLTRSPASILSEAGVLYAITAADGPPTGDSRIHDLALEASWAAKYAGLSERETIRLVSANVEDILGLEKSQDIVVWEGSPLAFGTPVLAFEDGGEGGRLELASCWPDERDD